MAYLNIADFKFGMDRRRPRSTGVPGTLWTLKNAVITRGGDVIRAKKFVSKYTLPAGTFGLASIKAQPYVFGSAADPGMPLGVIYQRLESPYSATMVRLIDAKPVEGKLYAIAQYDDGNIHHFYNGSRITDWDSITASSWAYVAEHLALKISDDTSVTAQAFGADIKITSRVKGTPFTCSATATDTDGDLSAPTATRSADTANVVAVAETRATATLTITGGSVGTNNKILTVTAGTTELIPVAVAFVSNNSATAHAVAVAINNRSAVHHYQAAAVGAVITITAPVGTGATKNGTTLSATKSGDVTHTHTNFHHGVNAIAAVAQVDKVTIAGAVFDGTDTWSVTVNGNTYVGTGLAGDAGNSILVHKRRVWSTSKSLLRYSKLNTYTDWTTTAVPSIDAGFINVSSETDGSQDLVGCGRYLGHVAVFADDNVMIYTLDTDADNNEFQQTIEQTGSRSPRSICSYMGLGIFYLSRIGIRAIQAQVAMNASYIYASDMGAAIDDFVQAAMTAAGDNAVFNAQAIADISTGRYMLAIGDQIITLSYFPTEKITAWSYIEPGFTVDGLTRAGAQIYARSGDTLYLYGGDDGDTFPDDDEQEVLLETPFMSANDPAGIKFLTGVDISCTNDWSMKILVDPNDETRLVDAGVITGFSYNKESKIGIPGTTSHVAFRLSCSRAGDAKLSSVAIHFDKGEAS